MRKKWIVWALLLALICSVFTGCKFGKPKTDTCIYYIDILGNGLAAQPYTFTTKTKEKRVKEAIKMLQTSPEIKESKRTIPEGIEVEGIEYDQKTLILTFNYDYQDMTGYTEVLIRAAIVKTMLQIKGIDSVVFYVADAPLMDQNGNLVGTMTADSFIDDYGAETGSLTPTTLTLYFASADGQTLVKKNKDVYYNKNIARERLIIEHLMKGVNDSDMNVKSVIPAGTKLLNITVNDGVCYVNFDSTFYKQEGGISSDVVLYSIVNSLTELDTINKVQLLVNGESVMPENGLTFKLGKSYERDTTMVLKAVEREVIVEDNK